MYQIVSVFGYGISAYTYLIIYLLFGLKKLIPKNQAWCDNINGIMMPHVRELAQQIIGNGIPQSHIMYIDGH